MRLGSRVRFLLLLASAFMCVAAALLQASKALPFDQLFRVSQELHSPAIPNDIPLIAVQAAVSNSRFESLVGGPVTLSPALGRDDTYALWAQHSRPEVASARVEQATKLLAVELERIALAEVDASQEHLQKLEKDVSTRLKRKADEKGLPTTRPVGLSNSEAKRVFRLQREIRGLEAFVSGGSRPAWIGPLLDRTSLTRQEKKLQAEKRELSRLQELWTPSSRAVQAQIKLVQREKAELLAIERHLAAVLLDSHRLELEQLEERSYDIVQQKKTIAESEDSVEPPESPLIESAAWIEQKSHALRATAKKLGQRAIITPVGKPTVEVKKPWGYWLCCGLWLTSAILLLAGLSVTERGHSKRRPPRPDHISASLGSRTNPEITSDGAFADLLARIEQDLGRPAERILVLSARGEDRARLSLRLAKSISIAQTKVKLIDFDLESRFLSQRVHSGTPSPGVSDLLTYGGPVEEFFASIPGTSIQFAPAGILGENPTSPDSTLLRRLLSTPPNGVTLIDASYSSPLEFLSRALDGVLLLRHPGEALGPEREAVLQHLRSSKVPIWGITQGSPGAFPYP